MGKDPAFLFYPGDYLRDTQNLSEKTQVAYDRIMCEHLTARDENHMKNICITQQQLKFFTKRLSDEEKEELMMMLRKKDGNYFIPWVAESIAKRISYSESRSKNKKGKTKIISKSYDNHMENENEDVITDSKLNKKIENNNLNTSFPFKNFLETYDKRVGDPFTLESIWMSLEEEDRKQITYILPAYIASKSEKKYRPNMKTFLENEMWKDEIISENGDTDYTELENSLKKQT